MIKVKTADFGALACIEPKEVYLSDPRWRVKAANSIESGQTSVSLWAAEMCIAVFGVKPIHAGVAELWAITSEAVKKYPIEFHRVTLSMLDVIIASHKLKRVQMTVCADFSEGVQWAGALGFLPEGVLKSYGPSGDDHIMFGRVC